MNGFLFSRRVISSYSWWRSHHCLFLVLFIISVWNISSVAFNVFSLFISRASPTFLSYMFEIRVIVLGWIQLNCPWSSLMCLVAPDDSELPFMLSCWCSMQRVNTFFFDSPIHLPVHQKSNWYLSGWWLLGSSFGLFWHRVLCKFLPDVK